MSTDDSSNALRKLPRRELQKLAKRHGVKGNGKTDAIIQKLVEIGVKIDTEDTRHQEPEAEQPQETPCLPSPPPEPVRVSGTPDKRLSAAQYLSGVNEGLLKKLNCPTPEPSSPSVTLQLSSPQRHEPPSPLPPQVGESISSRQAPFNAQPSDDSIGLEDYEVVMGEQETREPVASSHISRPPPLQKIQPFTVPRAQAFQLPQPQAQPAAAAPPRPPVLTPDRKHAYTNDPTRPIVPRVFWQADDPNRPSARSSQRPPTRKTARRYLRECLGYINEQKDLQGQVRDIEEIHGAAKGRLNAAERRLARIQETRVMIEKHWMQMLKADPRLHDGSWSWTRPATPAREVPPPPAGPPQWKADDYSSDLDSPDEEFEMAEEAENAPELRYSGPKRPRTQATQLRDAVARFEEWMSRM